MKILSLFLAVVALAGPGCQSRSVESPAGLRAEIESAMRGYAAALVKSPAAAAAFYAADGELIDGTTSHRGPQGVRDFLEPIWVKVDLAEARMESESVELLEGGAYQWGTYYQRAALKGQPLKEYRGRFVAKWRRGPDGRWLITRMMTNP